MSSKKNTELENLIQKFYNTKEGPGRNILLALIRRIDPNFKPMKDRK